MTNTELKIEKNVPMPPPRGIMNKWTQALRKMKVGDSFLAPIESRSSFPAIVGRLGMRVATRKEGDKLRVWRIA